jgi:hypothetical protein
MEKLKAIGDFMNWLEKDCNLLWFTIFMISILFGMFVAAVLLIGVGIYILHPLAQLLNLYYIKNNRLYFDNGIYIVITIFISSVIILISIKVIKYREIKLLLKWEQEKLDKKSIELKQS